MKSQNLDHKMDQIWTHFELKIDAKMDQNCVQNGLKMDHILDQNRPHFEA